MNGLGSGATQAQTTEAQTAPTITMSGGTGPFIETSGQTSGPFATTTTTEPAEQSHLDTVFAASGWTREDVLVIAAGIQIAMWVALLYLEVTE